jgi:hypothetical protein
MNPSKQVNPKLNRILWDYRRIPEGVDGAKEFEAIETYIAQATQAARRDELELMLSLIAESDPDAPVIMSVVDYLDGRLAQLVAPDKAESNE